MTRAAAAAALLAAALAGCGGGDGAAGPVAYDVVLVVGAAEPPTVEVGTDFSERWVLDCDGDACSLTREAGEPLGDVTRVELERVEGNHVGTASAGCSVVEVEVALEDEVLAGSVVRRPEPGCDDVDLTLGVSGSRPP